MYLFSQLQWSGSPREGSSPLGGFCRPNFRFIDSLFPPRISHMIEGAGSHSWASFIRTLVATMRLQFKKLITFLKTPAHLTVTLEIKFPYIVGKGEIGISIGYALDNSLCHLFYRNQWIITKNRLFIFQKRTSLEAKFILHIIQTKFKTHNIEEKN